MKKLLLLSIMLLLCIGVMAQSTLMITSGTITINGTAHGVTDVAYEANYSAGRIAFYNKFNPNAVYLRGEAPNGIKNGTSGNLFADMDEIVAYLSAGGVGSQPAGGGGGGGGGDASAANQVTGNNLLTTIRNNQVAGIKTAAGSQSVVLASDATLPLPTGAATAANQTSANTQLTAINTKTKPLISRTPTSVTVGTSSTSLTSANAAGYRVFIQNNSANDIWISIGGTATLAAPSIIIKAGGSYMTSSEYPDTQAITAISTASSVITVMTY